MNFKLEDSQKKKILKWGGVVTTSIFILYIAKLVISISFFISIFSLLPGSQNFGINLLVVGIDDAEGAKRSDAISIIHINSDEAKIKALSIPRDTRVHVNGIGITKINHAYAFGGIELLEDTVSRFLSIPIHNYIVVNTNGINDIIDAIGGVDVNIKENMKYDDFAANLHIDFKKGKQKLTGEKLMQYIRFRNNSQGDIGRIQRQQEVIKLLFDKVFRIKTLAISPKLLSIFFKAVDTDVSIKVINNYMKLFISQSKDLSIKFLTVPGSVRLIDGVSYWRPNIVYLDKMIEDTFVDYSMVETEIKSKKSADSINKRYITSKEIKRVTEQLSIDESQDLNNNSILSVEVLNGNGYAGVASSAASFLKSHQLNIVNIANSKTFNYEETIVVDWKGNLEKSLYISKLLDVKPSNIVVYDRQDKPIDVTIVLGKDLNLNSIEALRYARNN